MAGKKKVLHSIHHLITGAVLIIKGIDKTGHHALLGGLILVFGVLILAFFFYTLSKDHLSRSFELMVRWFEALVSLFTAYIFYSEGKTFLPYVFLLAALGFIISIFVFHRQKSHH